MGRLPSLGPTARRRLSRLLQAALAVMFVVGVATAYVALAVNAVLALAVTFVPNLLRRDVNVALGPGVTLAVAVAAFLHVVGMAGPYEHVWWWDHMTHALSATMVAAAAWVAVHALNEFSEEVYIPEPFLSVWVLLFTLAAGVGWELAEFAARALSGWAGVEPILVQYSVDDTLFDLVFDAVGAVVVSVAGGRRLRPLVDRVVETLTRRRDRL
ncbi:hypothetical protein [Candidatus Halobonum tyrrellensis]|uniref:Membrane-spanning protein n=1 Tax=Candidatus Halobonum tyrrellensis G22 TaxID=1324957 RepID=V4J2M7_9EURY|nr:hypothetical protein [Candidatus Halobonum tyrrellensis]ESP89657.1 hypothetical protein K933_03031 [Candidatus Halobonum tyrrellensis G22]